MGFRDAFGIRPLVLGSRPSLTGEGIDYMMASESVALKQLGYKQKDIVDILPGQAVIIQKGSAPVFSQAQERRCYAPDIFEYVYFARPDSIIDGIRVSQSRENMGRKLGAKIAQVLTHEELKEIDVVIPIPETSNTSAPCVAEELKKHLSQGFVKNRYIFRTFIMPGQKARVKGVRRKLNAMEEKFAGKNVLLVDDSIVRGTTSREIVIMAREAGARKVYFASCAPPITHAHIYGIDLASPSELIAHERDADIIAQHIGADKVIFQDLTDLQDACLEALPTGSLGQTDRKFEVGVFSGEYVTPVEPGYFKHLEQVRGGRRKPKTIEGARNAVASGAAGKGEFEVATNGVHVTDHGEMAPASRSPTPTSTTLRHDNHPNANGKRRRQSNEDMSLPRDRMDISLHNFGDYTS
jgi:amidophosphoribosyltransferase